MSERVGTGGNLPTVSTRIVGRTEIIETIARDLGVARFVSIVGAGGIGKTTVALAVAEQVGETVGDGAWFVDIAPIREPSLVPHAIASALGLVVHSANILNAVARHLRDREMLLVLDNCEHMAETVASCIARILEEAPRVRILVTSRAPLRSADEHVWRLPGLGTPPASAELTAASALTFPAIELFVERAADRVESFRLTDADAPAVADICRDLDGIALAIELAAMRVDVFGVRGLKKQLGDRLRALGTQRAGLERHRTLAATLDWSYGLLPVHETTVLCAVSVFAGVFRLDDARAISKLAPDEVAKILSELAAKSLLSVDAESGEYRPLETTRTYCLEKLLASGDDPVIRLRHAEYVCEVLERAAIELPSSTVAIWGRTYGRYLDDLRGALAWAGTDSQHRDVLVRLTTAGSVLWNHFSLADESRPHLQRAIAALRDAGPGGTATEMQLQLALAGAILYTQGIMPTAKVAMDHAIEIAIARKDSAYHLNCLRMIAVYELFSGQNSAALRTLESFVEKATVEDPSAVAEGETHLGCGELFIGRLRETRQRLERLYAHELKDLDDATALRFLYNNTVNILIVLSHAQWLTGSPSAAERTTEMVVDYSIKAHHEVSLSNGLAWSCLVYLWLGRDEECSRYTEMLEDLSERHGIVTWQPTAIFCRGALLSMNPDTLAKGVVYLEQAVADCRALCHMARFSYYLAVLAEALAKQGRIEEAEATIDEALAVAERSSDYWSFPEILRIRASIFGATGNAAEQEATLVKAMARAEELGATAWRLRAGIDLARVWQARSRTAEAKQLLRTALESFTEGFETRDVAIASQLVAQLA